MLRGPHYLRFPDAKTDESGKVLVEGLKNAGHEVSSFGFLKNDAEAIREKLDEIIHCQGLQAIIASGGTGASKRDITVETVTPLLEKVLPGFGELFRSLSYQEIGTGAILSRALAGVAWGKVVICLPGSVKAVKLAWKKSSCPKSAIWCGGVPMRLFGDLLPYADALKVVRDNITPSPVPRISRWITPWDACSCRISPPPTHAAF